MSHLTCPECGREGMSRLTFHLRRVHGLDRDAALQKHPGLQFESGLTHEIRCSSCKKALTGYSSRALYVKCDACRKTPLKHKRIEGDTHDRLACRVCGISRRRLASHIKSAHGLDPAAYMEQFPGALLDVPGSRARSPECKAKMAAAALKRWESVEERAAQSERLKETAAWKGKRLSEAHKAAISAGGKGVVHNYSAETRKARGERGRKVFEEMRKKPGHGERLAAGMARRHARGELVGFMNPETCAKGLASRIRNGTLIPMNGGRGICGFRKGLDHYCRSTLEANFARILLLEGIPYENEPHVFVLPSGGHYTPDFRLTRPLGDVVPAGWVELKGWRQKDGSLPGNTDEKVAGFKAATGESVFVLTMHDPAWKMLEAEYAPRIDLWETPTRNLRSHPEVFGR